MDGMPYRNAYKTNAACFAFAKVNAKQTATRIDSFQLCETEHFLYWGVLRYSKSGLVALRGEYCGTVGRLRYLRSPTNDDFTAFVKHSKGIPMRRFFCLHLNTKY